MCQIDGDLLSLFYKGSLTRMETEIPPIAKKRKSYCLLAQIFGGAGGVADVEELRVERGRIVIELAD